MPTAKIVKPRRKTDSRLNYDERILLAKSYDYSASTSKTEGSQANIRVPQDYVNVHSHLADSKVPKPAGEVTPSPYRSSRRESCKGSGYSPSAIPRSRIQSANESPALELSNQKAVDNKKSVGQQMVARAALERKARPRTIDYQSSSKINIYDFDRQARAVKAETKIMRSAQKEVVDKAKCSRLSFAESHHNKRIKDIFDRLDSDQDGVICPNNIDVSLVSAAQLKVICPILFAMETRGKSLDYHEFEREVKALLDRLTPLDRQAVYYGRQSTRGSANRESSISKVRGCYRRAPEGRR